MNIDSTFIPNSWSGYEAWLKGIYLYLEQNGRTGVPVYLNADESDFDLLWNSRYRNFGAESPVMIRNFLAQ